jgi:hypothetical protein
MTLTEYRVDDRSLIQGNVEFFSRVDQFRGQLNLPRNEHWMIGMRIKWLECKTTDLLLHNSQAYNAWSFTFTIPIGLCCVVST